MRNMSITRYEAFDGKEFDNVAECRKYEKDNLLTRFVELTLDDVLAAASREDTGLADAFEIFGTQLATQRRASGDMKRERKKVA